MKMGADFIPRKTVNGNMLRSMKDENVSIMLRVLEEAGYELKAMSTDGQEIRVQLPNNEPIGARKGNWVEIIGTPTGGNEVRANDTILFSDEDIDFDMDAYNMLVNFLDVVKDDIYRTES